MLQLTENSHPKLGGRFSYHDLLLQEMKEISLIMGIDETNDYKLFWDKLSNVLVN